jgi:hypothetical protein
MRNVIDAVNNPWRCVAVVLWTTDTERERIYGWRGKLLPPIQSVGAKFVWPAGIRFLS